MLDPAPHAHPQRYEPLKWPGGTKHLLLPHSGSLSLDFAALLEQRQTRRNFTVELSEFQLGEFLWLACRSRSARPSAFGPDQESRPHPSAGAMHPIHVLTCQEGKCWSRYDPVNHVLIELPSSEAVAAAARAQAEELLPISRGLLLALVAEPGRTAAKYGNPESLVWRDAGVVLGYMSLVAEALSLSFCALGVTGNRHVNQLAPSSPGTLLGVGMAVLGGSNTEY